jgi:hypothetical protein
VAEVPRYFVFKTRVTVITEVTVAALSAEDADHRFKTGTWQYVTTPNWSKAEKWEVIEMEVKE